VHGLRNELGDVTDRTLTRQLRELEDDGLVHREVFAEVPPRVEYSLTPLGHSLRPVVTTLEAWGKQWAHSQGVSIAEELSGRIRAGVKTRCRDACRGIR
jgi:DNA-binding HxlR family transcriptional regulator